ncbi:MAG: PAS domain S-box protein [Bacteroidales bacterium]|nr:PAS domain S-box protein [Bacteroidales bacterium]
MHKEQKKSSKTSTKKTTVIGGSSDYVSESSTHQINETNNSEIIDYKYLFDALYAGTFVMDEYGKILLVNKAFESLTLYSKHELVELNFNSLLTDKFTGELMGIESTHNKANTNLHEVRLKRKDSKLIWCIVSISKIEKNQSGKDVYLAQIHSISDIKKSEEKNKKDKELLNYLINSIPENIYVKDINSQFIYVNKSMAQQLGHLYPEELISKSDFDYFPQKTAKKLYDDEQEIIRTGHPKINMEEKLISKKGRIRWYSTSKMPWFDENGNVIGIIGIGLDITDLKEEQRKLKKAKRLAEKADQLKSSFLANMSHEIRTPLNGILGFSQFLRNKDLSVDKKNRYLDIILSSGNQLLGLINDIIDISKIDSGQLRLNCNSFSLNNLLNQLYVYFKEELVRQKKTGIYLELKKTLSELDTFIVSDELRIKQVLINLLSNAMKFTNRGSIIFGCERIDQNLTFFVKDTGIGIKEKLQSEIFERFRQVDSSYAREYGGTGLGLAISKGLIELLEGEIWVESKTNKGSTFWFTVPFIPGQKPAESPLDISQISINWEDKKILVVEDDEFSYQLLETLFEDKKIKLLHASDGLKAIQIVKNSKNIDMVLMDIKLPDIDGYTATAKIKSIQKKLPVIAQTAYASEDEKNKCLQAGCDDYIEKPLKIEKLQEILEKYLKKK